MKRTSIGERINQDIGTAVNVAGKQELLRSISEKDFSQQIYNLATWLKWKVYRTWKSIHSPSGFPDLVLVRERIVFAELKSEGSKLTSPQLEWVLALDAAGGEAYAWWPHSWEEIIKILERS